MSRENEPEVLVTDVRPGGEGPIEELLCWEFAENRRAIDYYHDEPKWIEVVVVKRQMLRGQRFRVARLDGDDFELGAALELVLRTKGNKKGWDNLETLQREHED